MIRWTLWLLAGALLGGIVHLVAVLALPHTATQDAFIRLAQITQVNTVTAVPQPTPQSEVMPFMDPAFASSVCRYDLSAGPIKLAVPVSPAYTSVSFYTRRGVAYYAINDRAAGRRLIELQLMTSAQRADLPDDEDVTAADRLIVESPTKTGLILMRALAPEPGLMAATRAVLNRATCRVEPLPEMPLGNSAADALLQQRERALGLDGQRRGRCNHHALDRDPVGFDALVERALHPQHDVAVLRDALQRVGLLLSGQRRDAGHCLLALAIHVGDIARRLKERIEP